MGRDLKEAARLRKTGLARLGDAEEAAASRSSEQLQSEVILSYCFCIAFGFDSG
jgi:hypothetical protein